METLKLILILAVVVMQLSTAENTIVQTVNGPVKGIVKPSRNSSVNFVSFLGLRYADPPPRFEPAKPLTEIWSSPKLADTPGDICLQVGLGGSDDCLFLNVHVPSSALADPEKRLPVMFWIHGGAFTMGEGHTYGAELLMENEDVILITINYRLGVLGFIFLENEATFTANNGLRDIVLALQWVRDNIAIFHGNPEKVTVFGQSAGSAAIDYLLQSPLASGLFHRAIMESGAHCFWSYQQHPRENALSLAKYLDCQNTADPSKIRKCLENTEGLKLVEAQMAITPRWPPILPVNRFLPTAKEPQINAFFASKPSSFFTFPKRQSHYVNKVPVILGTNRDEGSNLFTSFIIAVPGQLEYLNANWTEVLPKLVSYDTFFPQDKLQEISNKLQDFYLDGKMLTQENLEPLVRLFTDSQFLLPAMQATENMIRNGISVYPYRYSYLGPTHFHQKFGIPVLPNHVAHADELQHLFEHPVFGADGKVAPGSEHESFSKRLVKLWTRFADTGVPELEWDDKVTWNPARVADDGNVRMDILEIDASLKMLNADSFKDRLDFWRKTLNNVVERENEARVEL